MNEEEKLKKVAPGLFVAVEKLNVEVLTNYLKHGWKIDFPITSTGISLYSLLMGYDSEIL